MMVQNDGLIFLSVDIDDFFALGDGSERLVDDFEGFERLGGGVELSETAIDQHQAGHGIFLFLQAPVTARDHFAHGGEIVHAFDGLDDELPVVRFFHLAVFPDDHRCDGFRSLNVRDVETLDALWQLGKGERVLKGFLDGARVWLQNAETLVVGLLGVSAGEIDEFALVSALRNGDVDARGPSTFAGELFAEGLFEFFAVLEIYRDVDVARHVGLREVELLDKGGEEFSGMEGIGGGTGGDARLSIVWFVLVRREFGEFFPEKFAAVEDFSAPHVEQVHGQHPIFVVIAEDVGVVAFYGGYTLLLLELLDG